MTSLIRWNAVPARNLLGFHEDVDRLFEGLLQTPGAAVTTRSGLPAADLEETADAFVVRLDLPGVSPKDVKVNVLADTLTIRGERTLDRKDRTMHRAERQHGTFERTFTLGVPVQGDQVKATFRDGVLDVHVPKADAAKVRDIEIQIGS